MAKKFTYSCCFLGFFRGLISTGGLVSSSSSSFKFIITAGLLSSLTSGKPGLEVADIVVLPPIKVEKICNNFPQLF